MDPAGAVDRADTLTRVVCTVLPSQGRRLLRQWFLRPVVQLGVISSRHDTIELLVAAPTTNDALRAAMKKVRQILIGFLFVG
jgi:DNA mismatch repair ATPase MutS